MGEVDRKGGGVYTTYPILTHRIISIMANEANLKANSERTPKERVELARKAGKASGKKRRERKTIADALRKVLDEPITKGSRQTRLDGISIKVVKKMFDDPDIRDMKILAEIFGEIKQTLTTDGDGLTIVVKSQEEKDKLDNMGGLSI